MVAEMPATVPARNSWCASPIHSQADVVARGQSLTMTPKRRALLLVDIQNDFLPPSGSLAVPQGDRILDPVRKLLTDARWDLVVASQDHHPPGHVSFASSHTGKKPLSTIELASGKMQVLWPDHCVQGAPALTLESEYMLLRACTGTGGASIEASVVERLDRLQAVIVRKVRIDLLEIRHRIDLGQNRARLSTAMPTAPLRPPLQALQAKKRLQMCCQVRSPSPKIMPC